jgi:hypothetical protein
MKVFFLAFFLSLLMGCAYSPQSVQIEIDSSFPSDKIQLIQQSLQDWHQVTNGGFTVSNVSIVDNISGDTEFNTIKFVNKDVEEQAAPEKGLTMLGYTNTEYSTPGHPEDHVEAVIFIWDQETDIIFGATARHELGHAFLVNHYCTEAQGQESWTQCEVISADPGPSIMYPILTGATLTVQDIDSYRFCQQWGCPQ